MKCPDCDSKLRVADERCGQCGRTLADLNLSALNVREASRKRIIGIGLVVSALVLGGGFVAKQRIEQQRIEAAKRAAAEQAAAERKLAQELLEAEQQRIAAEKADYSWVPDGFTKFGVNYNMAYKSISYEAADCYSNCWGFLVIARDSCSSMEVSANIMRDSVILDTDSDFASDVPAQTKVVMRITSSADLPWNASVTEARCT